MVSIESHPRPAEAGASGVPAALIGPDEPSPFQTVEPQGQAACLLLVCDHASRRIPRALDRLGLEEPALERHIAWDIGAAAVTRGLAERLQARAVLAGYSRLVVDCNRRLDDPTAFIAVSDGQLIPGNLRLSAADKAARAESFFWPYHREIARQLVGLRRDGRIPALVSIHSFTAFFMGSKRPWQAGVLWNRDQRIALPLMRRLTERHGLLVGDNEPYSGRSTAVYTVEAHAEQAGLPHVAVEIRQDLVQCAEGIERWVEMLGGALEHVLADPELYCLRAGE